MLHKISFLRRFVPFFWAILRIKVRRWWRMRIRKQDNLSEDFGDILEMLRVVDSMYREKHK